MPAAPEKESQVGQALQALYLPNGFNRLTKSADRLLDRGRKEGRAEVRAERTRKLRATETQLLEIRSQKDVAEEALAEFESRLSKHSKAVGVVSGMLQRAEQEWVPVHAFWNKCSFLFISLVYVLISAALIFGAYVLQGLVGGLAVAVVCVLLGFMTFLADIVNRKRQELQTGLATWIVGLRLRNRLEELNQNLGPDLPTPTIKITSTGVDIENKVEILESVS